MSVHSHLVGVRGIALLDLIVCFASQLLVVDRSGSVVVDVVVVDSNSIDWRIFHLTVVGVLLLAVTV